MGTARWAKCQRVGANISPLKRMMSRSIERGAFLSAERILPIFASNEVRIFNFKAPCSRKVYANKAALRKFGQ